MKSNVVRGIVVCLVAIILWSLPVPAGLKPQAWHLFAIFVATILGFILSPLPMGAVALIAVTATAFFKVASPAQALSGFSNTTIWLIVAAFIFAKGFIKTGLGSRIAYLVMHSLGNSTLKLAYAILISDLIIAPATPSNTARGGGILFPIVRSLCSAFGSEPNDKPRRIGSYLMQSAFHGNMITSAMFLTAQAGNPLLVALTLKLLNIEISWGLWALAALVPGLVSMAVIPYLIYKLDPPEVTATPEARQIARAALDKMGPVSRNEKIVALVFISALVLWATATYTKLDATVVALLGVSAMLMTGVLKWTDVTEEKSAWDTMVWMGTLVGLAGLLNSTGFIAWFAKLISTGIAGLSWMSALLVLLLLFFYSHYAFASLSAHITAMYPAFAPVAVIAGAPPYLVALSMGFFASLCASLTHYSTGPAPIYFGAGYVDQGKWWRIGFIVSFVNIVIWLGIGGVWWKILGLW
ncbi:MAG: anion permease [Negativicutes bacterium]